MGNLPNENNQGNPPQSGEIFSADSRATYDEAVRSTEGTAPNIPFQPESGQTERYQDPSGLYYRETTGGNQGGDLPNQGASLPSYYDNRGKKFLVLIVFLLLFILLGFLFYRFILKKGTPGKSGDKASLIYWGLWEDENIMKGVLDDYRRQNPDVTIEYISQNKTQYRERLQAAIDRNEGPDVFRFHNTWLPMMMRQLSSVPKEIYTYEEYKNTFYPVAISDLSSGENIYGIPLMVDGLMLFYNEKILSSANVSVPRTWVDVLDSVSKLTVRQGDEILTSAIALGTAENIEHFSDILGLMMIQNGTRMGESLFRCIDDAKTDCAVETLTYFRRFTESPYKTWTGKMDNSVIAFAGSKVAMILAPSWQVYTIKALNKDADFSFRTAPVPQLPCPAGNCPPVHWGSYWVEGVSVKSKYQKQAWDLLKYLSSSDVMEKLYNEQVKVRQLFGEPYSRVDMGSKLQDNPYISTIINEAPYMRSFPLASRTYDGDTGLNSGLITYLKDGVNSLDQGVSFESALRTAEEGFKQVFSRFGISR